MEGRERRKEWGTNGGPASGHSVSCLHRARMTFCSLQSRAEGEISPAKIPLGSSSFCQTQGHPVLSVAAASVPACEGRALAWLHRTLPPTKLSSPSHTLGAHTGSAHPTLDHLAVLLGTQLPCTHWVSDSFLQLPVQTSTSCLSEGPSFSSQWLFLSICSWGRGRSEEESGFGITWVSLNSDLSSKVGLAHSCGPLGQVTEPPSASVSPGRMEIMLLIWQGDGILSAQHQGWFKGSDSQAAG